MFNFYVPLCVTTLQQKTLYKMHGTLITLTSKFTVVSCITLLLVCQIWCVLLTCTPCCLPWKEF